MTDIDHAAILRQHADTRRRGHSVNPDVLRAAAEELDRIRAELDRLGPLMLRASSEITKLRAERDDARRRLCVELFEVEGHPFGWTGARGADGIAERLGWDCFKENTDD